MYLLLPLFFSFVLGVLQHFFLPQIKEIWRIGIELQTLFSIIPEIQWHKQGMLFIWQDMNPNIKTKEGHIKENMISQTLKCFTEEHKRDDHWPPAPSVFTVFPGIQVPNFRKITLTQAPDKKRSVINQRTPTPITQILLLKYWANLCGCSCSATDSNWLWDSKHFNSFPLRILLSRHIRV